MRSVPKVYLASPLGFAESTREFMALLEGLLRECGYAVSNPWRLADKNWFQEALRVEDAQKRQQALHSLNMRVGANNEQAIRECDLIVAVLDGVDVDSGTASEVGFGYALAKRIYGYRGDFRRAGDNEGSLVNLQVEYWITRSGGYIVTTLEDLRSALSK